jgi:hydrogenase maturation protease
LLGLGNEILADDAFGILAAREVARRFQGEIEVVQSSSAGYDLMDHLLGARRLLVVDTIVTGRARPGAISVFTADRVQPAPGGSPHFLGLFEVLAVGRKLHLDVPKEIIVIAVEASDCVTVGGPIHPDVQSAIPEVVELVGQFLANGTLHIPKVWEQ